MYERVELKEGVPVQFLGVHATKWRQEWGEPTVGFRESETDAKRDGEDVRRLRRAGRIEAALSMVHEKPKRGPANPPNLAAATWKMELTTAEKDMITAALAWEGDDAEGDG